jgi:serine/threonine protein kinase
MGTVELVLRRGPSFQRFDARKRLHPQFRDDPPFLTMFLEEARLAGLIRHPNVVSVLDVGEDAEGPFLVMEYVESKTLQHVVAHHATTGTMLPIQLCARLGAQIAAGLHAAHELRDASGRPLELVHRDVSPQNVLVGFDGLVRVTDFGIAKAIGRSTRTGTGMLKGKLSYMSPEQLRFQPADRRSDLFALGVVLYEMIVLGHPFPAEDPMARARRILEDAPSDPAEARPDTPAAIVELLFELLADDPELRPKTAGEVQRRLEQIIDERVLEEGPMEIASYMDSVFGEARDRTRAAITARVRAIESGLDPEEPRDERSSPGATRVITGRGAGQDHPARARALWTAAAIGLTVGLAALAITEAVASRSEGGIVGEPAAGAHDAVSAAGEAAPTAIAASALAPGADAGIASASGSPARERRSEGTSRRSRRTGATPERASKSGIPMWREWQ